MGNSFKTKKIGENNFSEKQKKITFGSVLKYFTILACICIVIFGGIYLVKSEKIKFPSIGQGTVNVVSNKFGEEMKRDQNGNVNILLVGIGGDGHQGGYLSDTIIVVSRNQDLGAVTMISVPRDLYVKTTGYAGKINGLFARGYNKEKSIVSGAQLLTDKLQEMMGLDIPYYAVVDFKGFKEVVDTIGGVEIYIPYTIHDTDYPDEGIGYETFHISAGQQILDGDTALKYARSRHTTSDFSRSQRQQELIKAIIDTAMKKENITSISTLRELYDTYTRMVNTNISSKEMIGAVKYISNPPKIFSFGLNTYCTYSSYKLTDTACFLYNGNREAFNGMATILPNGGSPSNVSFYDYIQNFVSFVAHDQQYLIENPRIVVKNAIDKSYASQNGKSPTGRAMKLAVKMKKYGFSIAGTENASEPLEQTTAIVYGNDYPNTIQTLQKFLPINVVKSGQILSVENTGDELQFEPEDLGYDIQLLIGNDFIDFIKENPFSYEK